MPRFPLPRTDPLWAGLCLVLCLSGAQAATDQSVLNTTQSNTKDFVKSAARQSVSVRSTADGYIVRLAGQAQGFRLDTVRDTVDALPGGPPPRTAPVPAARLQAWLKDLKTGRITPLAASADGFALPSGLEDGVHRYALKVSGGGLGERPCPPGCSAPGYLTISIDKGTYKSAGDPKAEGF